MALAWLALFGVSFFGLVFNIKGLEKNWQYRKRWPDSETLQRLRWGWNALVAVHFVLCCWCLWNLAASL